MIIVNQSGNMIVNRYKTVSVDGKLIKADNTVIGRYVTVQRADEVFTDILMCVRQECRMYELPIG